ncbi:MAG: hypothetical protein ACREBZ_06170 [Thermoplasmata archaeon]
MMGSSGGPPPDLSNAEVVDYEAVGGDGKLRLKLKDGSVIEVRLEIMNILRAGNDGSTGLPTYIVQSTPLIRLVECPKELRKAPMRPGGPKDPKSVPGFA